MSTYSHRCIKCNSEYSDVDPDPYLCEECNAQRLLIAKEVDKKMAVISSRPKKVTLIDQYNSAPKIRGFVSAKDLGIEI